MDAPYSTPPIVKKPGTIVTFYSFKGGVGRSMALANVAILLARAGKKVLCVDWDLEAPGLDRYFRAVPRSAPDKIPSLSEPAERGGLLSILENSSADRLVEWQDYVRIRTGADGTQLDFIGSGDDEDDYSVKLGAFSWNDFFSRSKGGDTVEALRNAWKQNYDYILIDSRTGLTDSSGVCTIQMPDLIVMLFAANEQNVDWCRRIARGIRNGRSKLPYDRTFLPIIPILSRFDAREESDRASEAMDRIATQFNSFFADWLPSSITARAMLAWSVLPYVPRYSFEEALAVEDEPATGAQGLSFYYELLSRLILARFAGIRTVLASFGVPGAALPPLLPSSTELDSELRQDVDAVDRYATYIKSRAEEDPLEAAEALETLAAACASTSRLHHAEPLLTDAISILSDPAIDAGEVIARLKRKRAELAMRVGVFRRRFRIAFSFAVEKREFVAQVAAILAKSFGESNILYDAYHEVEFARDNLSIELPELYYKQSDLVVAIISPRYQSGDWCGLEWTALADLLMKRRNSEVLLCRFEHAEDTGLFSNAGFVELDHKTPEQTAVIIMERLALNEGRPRNYYTTSTEPKQSSAAPIPNNLPRLQPFFGRTKELKQIADALDPESRTWGALIDGPSGIGKTSLAVRAAYDCPLGQFQRIIFLSVKDRELDAQGERQLGSFILPGFLEMLNELARELGQSDITKAPETDRTRLLLAALVPAHALLLLDNLESLTTADRDELFSFVKRLPQGCKAILTSRRRIGSGSELLILENLDEAAALEMLANLAQHNPVLAKTSEDDRRSLYEQTGGVPLLLRWTAGQLGRGHVRTVPDALAFLRSCPPNDDPLEFMFGDLANEFSSEETEVLAMLTYFTLPVKVKHIATSVSMNEKTVETVLHTLANRSVVVPDMEEQAFSLVPMVADFLRRKRPQVVAEMGRCLEMQAYSLIVENGYVEYDQFPVLDEVWPTVAPALRLFIDGPSPRLQTVCDALKRFLDFTGRWDEWLSLTQQAEAKAVSVGDLNSAGWRAYESGAVHSRRHQGDAVLACAERAANHWNLAGAGDRERAAAIRLRGIGHQLNENYDTAIVAYREALALGRTLSPESADIAIGLNWLANAEKESGDLAAAEQNYRESLRVSRAGSYAPLIATATKNLAEVALLREDWSRAEALARDALQLSEKVGRQELIADDCHRLARALVRQDQFAEALPYARRALDIYTQLKLPAALEAVSKTLEECEA